MYLSRSLLPQRSRLQIDNLKDNFSKELKSQIDAEFTVEIDAYYVNWGLEMAENHGVLV